LPVPPEVAFDRFFQEQCPYKPPVRPEDPDPRLYRGRDALSGLQPILERQLRLFQHTFNEALRNEKRNVPEHVDHPPFHVDYVDSSIDNALAFRYEGYSFIGITVPLIYTLSQVCLRLSTSETVARVLGVEPSNEEYNLLQAVFNMVISFVVTHEWTHHVHGHLEHSENIFPHEVLDTGCNGDLAGQVKELAADGYSVYHALANFIDGDGRSMLRLIGLDSEQANIQDRVLFDLFVIAVGAYLFVRPAPELSQVDVFTLTHPPQAVRMNFVMLEAMGWCKQNRPELQAWMTATRFQQLMNAATRATLGMSGGQVWGRQAAFMNSERGTEYMRALAEGIDANRQSLMAIGVEP